MFKSVSRENQLKKQYFTVFEHLRKFHDFFPSFCSNTSCTKTKPYKFAFNEVKTVYFACVKRIKLPPLTQFDDMFIEATDAFSMVFNCPPPPPPPPQLT